MNSTPIGKLPPPFEQTDGQSGATSSDNYGDILRNLERQRQQQSQPGQPTQSGQPGGQPGGQAPPQIQPMMQQQPMMQHQHQPMMQHQQQPMMQHQQQPMMQQQPYQVPQNARRPTPRPASRRTAPASKVEKFVETPAKVPVPSKRRFDLKSLRPAFLVAVIVFLVLSRGAPLIAAHVPFSIDAVTGKFTIAGLAFVSMLSGGAFLGLIDIVDRFSF